MNDLSKYYSMNKSMNDSMQEEQEELEKSFFSQPKKPRGNLDTISALENNLKNLLAEGFRALVMNPESSEEDFQRLASAYNKFKKSSAALEKAKRKQVELEQKKLGSLTIGDQGQKDFGPFRLVWVVNSDHIEWSLNEIEDPQESWLTGALKHKGWNRIEIGSEIPEEMQIQAIQQRSSAGIRTAPPCFQVYVHQWSAFKEAMDFLYYDLGRKSAKGTYEDSFVNETKKITNFCLQNPSCDCGCWDNWGYPIEVKK